jgi:hypothetical protein
MITRTLYDRSSPHHLSRTPHSSPFTRTQFITSPIPLTPRHLPARSWANWAFEVESISANRTITVGKGGFQGARGGPGSDWFVQNVFEELDDPTEFYYDSASATLYVVSNETSPHTPPRGTYEAVPTANHTLLSAVGSNVHPIVNLTLRGIGFRDTAWTMLQPHGVVCAHHHHHPTRARRARAVLTTRMHGL